jgi:hypothetical protein
MMPFAMEHVKGINVIVRKQGIDLKMRMKM